MYGGMEGGVGVRSVPWTPLPSAAVVTCYQTGLPTYTSAIYNLPGSEAAGHWVPLAVSETSGRGERPVHSSFTKAVRPFVCVLWRRWWPTLIVHSTLATTGYTL